MAVTGDRTVLRPGLADLVGVGQGGQKERCSIPGNETCLQRCKGMKESSCAGREELSRPEVAMLDVRESPRGCWGDVSLCKQLRANQVVNLPDLASSVWRMRLVAKLRARLYLEFKFYDCVALKYSN